MNKPANGPLQRVLDALEQHGCKPSRSGDGWTAFCPAHEADGRRHSPSLSVAVGDDGRVLLHCHGNSGCTAESIVKALGLGLADLMPQDGRPDKPPAKASRQNNKPTGKTYPSANAALNELRKRHGRESARWVYHNAQGEPVGLAVRWKRCQSRGPCIACRNCLRPTLRP